MQKTNQEYFLFYLQSDEKPFAAKSYFFFRILLFGQKKKFLGEARKRTREMVNQDISINRPEEYFKEALAPQLSEVSRSFGFRL